MASKDDSSSKFEARKFEPKTEPDAIDSAKSTQSEKKSQPSAYAEPYDESESKTIPTVSIKSKASMKSGVSMASTGIGSANPAQNKRDMNRADLPPKLTAEGLSIDPNIKIYDAIVYLIYCPEHDKIAVTNVERARCVWLPFVGLPDGVTWLKASHDGVAMIIGNKDTELDADVAAKKAPVYELTYLNVLRIQLPTERFVTRLANLVLLKKSAQSTFVCCQRSPRINWVRACDIIGDRIDKIWGPEVRKFTQLLVDISAGQHETIVSEFSIENSFHYLMMDNSPEQKLLRASHIKPEHIVEIYDSYIEHCYPSFYMSYESFKYFLSKYGYNVKDRIIPFLFNAFSLYGNDYLDFHEVLLGFVAMEPTTKHLTESRLKFIFRYYDTTRSGFLKLDAFVVMVQDMWTKDENGNAVQISDAELTTKVEEAVRSVGMKEQQIPLSNFLKAVYSNKFHNTEKLCRSPSSILAKLSRLVEVGHDGKVKPTNVGFLGSRRKGKGTCTRCRTQQYEYSLHCVTFDTVGRCVEPRIISEQWYDKVCVSGMNLQKYSIEYVFRNSSVPNIFIDMVKEFYYRSQAADFKGKGMMSAKEDWPSFTKYMTILCEELRGLLLNEEKLIKINAPALVVGDLQGSLHDLFRVEQVYLNSFPVVAHNTIFLGNYTGVYPYGVECLALLFSMKLCAPNKIFLLRGTNEMQSQNKQLLSKECNKKYGNTYGPMIYKVVNEIYQRLPFAIIIDENVLCVHSGIPKSTKIAKLSQIHHDVHSVIRDAPIGYELLVNAPTGIESCFNEEVKDLMKGDLSGLDVSKSKSKSRQKSQKSMTRRSRKSISNQFRVGSSLQVSGFNKSDSYFNAFEFDETAFENFMEANSFSHLIRSHSVIPEAGFDLRYNNRCITVFSCSDYVRQCYAAQEMKPPSVAQKSLTNSATAAFVDGSNMSIRILTFDPPDVETSSFKTNNRAVD